jgi:hypothetical protein
VRGDANSSSLSDRGSLSIVPDDKVQNETTPISLILTKPHFKFMWTRQSAKMPKRVSFFPNLIRSLSVMLRQSPRRPFHLLTEPNFELLKPNSKRVHILVGCTSILFAVRKRYIKSILAVPSIIFSSVHFASANRTHKSNYSVEILRPHSVVPGRVPYSLSSVYVQLYFRYSQTVHTNRIIPLEIIRPIVLCQDECHILVGVRPTTSAARRPYTQIELFR